MAAYKHHDGLQKACLVFVFAFVSYKGVNHINKQRDKTSEIP